MKIKELKLINFRNYSNITIKFGSNMNIFVGDNAQGKTNILESIVILALTKSHRVGINPNIVMFNKKKAKIKGNIKNDLLLNKLEIDISDDKKLLYINNNNIKKVSDYISFLNVIVFSPDDLDIIKGSPSIRRNLLNIQLSQISKRYLNTYNEFNKILKTRNEYLKILYNNSIADKKYLDIITDKLVEKAIIIYKHRKEYIDLINSKINYYYNNIANNSKLKIIYEPNININFDDFDNIENELKNIYKNNYHKELNCGMTLYGPHRDDFIFYLDGKDLKYYGSQGQQKVAIISYKLSEIPIFNNFTGSNPILLLDDIFSELDIKKRNKLLKIINNNVQSIITTTDLKNINKKYLNNAFIFEVKNGNIDRK